mmetsp:Transcript_9762/g.14563  ORF Transcript_9762/g.14563 Transcript_9762/m.14563 type:complete len:139 (-) Transcript_9762:36-452(-)
MRFCCKRMLANDRRYNNNVVHGNATEQKSPSTVVLSRKMNMQSKRRNKRSWSQTDFADEVCTIARIVRYDGLIARTVYGIDTRFFIFAASNSIERKIRQRIQVQGYLCIIFKKFRWYSTLVKLASKINHFISTSIYVC